MRRIHHHFSKIARKYRNLRTTDLAPILFIKNKLQGLTKIDAADIGCGAGRYDIKLHDYLGKKLRLTCIDDNENMLGELIGNFEEHKINPPQVKKASADNLPITADSLDAIFTFNAIHHFKLSDFLKEAARTLKDNGYLIIYTRLRSQNKRNIWGRFFPEFHEKERRLYELNELKKILKERPILKLESIKYFKYKRAAGLERLINQAINHHYSTFFLYNKREFKKALKKFRESITQQFKNPDRISWYDENVMLVIRKKLAKLPNFY